MDRTAELCLLLVLLLQLQVALSQVTYHISPTLESPCFHGDCYTLSEVATNTDRYFHNDTTLVFLPGVHVLDVGAVVLENMQSVSFVGDSSSPDTTTTIFCNWSSAIIFVNITSVRMASLSFSSCGRNNDSIKEHIANIDPVVSDIVGPLLPAMSVLSVAHFHIETCTLEYNYVSVFSYKTTLTCNNSWFEGNTADKGGAMVTFHSKAFFVGQNVFTGNNASKKGGGVYAESSKLVFKENVQFIGNSATVGGAIYTFNTRVSFHLPSNGSFIHNYALEDGGGITVLYGTVSQHENTFLNFTGNVADSKGGAITSFGTGTIDLGGVSVFANNTASSDLSCGGAVYLSASTWISQAVTISDNTASYGGALYATHSELYFEGSSRFIHNSASGEDGGGALYATWSTVRFLETNFTSNSAINGEGGAVYLFAFSNLGFLGTTNFKDNSASGPGGGIYCAESSLHFTGHTTFSSNYALSGAGTSIRYCDATLYSTSEITFTDNVATAVGGGIMCDIGTNIFIGAGKSQFTNNTASFAGGAIFASGIVTLSSNCEFMNNSASLGGAIYVDGDCRLLGSCLFEGNTANHGGAAFIDNGNLLLHGGQHFHSNRANHEGYGGAIHSLRGSIKVEGIVNFTRNTASHGGALAITQYSETKFLGLGNDTKLSFVANSAKQAGGAIVVNDGLMFTYCTYPSQPEKYEYRMKMPCFFQVTEDCYTDYEFYPSENDTLEYLILRSIHMFFDGNYAAQGGNDLYGGALEICKVCTGAHGWYIYGTDGFTKLTRTLLEHYVGKPLLSSDPYRVCLCDQLTPNCSQTSTSYSVYPGETISAPIVSVGQVNGTVAAVIQVRTSPSAVTKPSQTFQQVGKTCTYLNYTIIKSNALDAPETELVLFIKGSCGELGYPVSLFVRFIPCPSGFSLLTSGVCGCEQRLQKYTKSCDINDRTITRNGDFWVGYDQSHGLVLHPHCPFDYCTLETVSLTLNSTDLQCAHGRSGTLCGACKSGLSLNLGSSHCSSCSNAYVFLLLPFAAAGFLLVVLLFVIKLTVSAGTISGLIFFANVVAVNRSVLFPPGDTNVLTVFIAWLNLDLGIETCFFGGMDAYTRTWLQFVFPLYIWSLVGLITLVTHYSMTVAKIIGPTNPVSVLATLFLISYTKLLRTIIATFSFTTLDYPNDSSKPVWAHDGNVGYIEGKHIALFLAGLLAFLFLFLPYTVLLLCGQCFIAGSNHKLLRWVNKPVVKSFLDAYYAPYQDRHRYWVGLLLVLRFLLFIISAVIDINSPRDPSINLLVLATTCVGITTLTWNMGSVYKKWYNNILESSFILNLAILAVASYQVKVEGGSQLAVIYTSVSVAFVTFLGVFSYHVIERVGDTRSWRHTLKPRLHRIGERFSIRSQENEGPIEMEPPPVAPPPVVPTTFVELREALLETH